MNLRNTVARYVERLFVAVALVSLHQYTAASALELSEVSVLIEHSPNINGLVDGNLHFNRGENFNLNGGGIISGTLSVPGTPSVKVNKRATAGEVVEGVGSISPSGYKIHINGNSELGTLATRSEYLALSPSVSTIPPTGNRHVNINTNSDEVGDFSTIRNLNINAGGISLNVPPGAYGNFGVNNGAEIVIGSSISNEPLFYSFERLQLNGSSKLTLAGPVVVVLANGFSSGGTIGNPDNSDWLLMNMSKGGLNLNSNGRFYGVLKAPNGHVNINGNARFEGALEADRLNLNGGGVIVGCLSILPDSNKAPFASDLSLDLVEDGSVFFALVGGDPDGDTLSYTVRTEPEFGILVGTAPDLEYIPYQNYYGLDEFSYSVGDGQEESNIAVAMIDILSVNDRPIANPQDVFTLEDAPVEILLTGEDVESSELVFAITSPPLLGTLDLTEIPRVRYLPNQDSDEDDSFSFTVSDGELVSTPALVSIGVTPVNDAPGAVPLNLSLFEDQTFDLTLLGDDTEGDVLEYKIKKQPSHGLLTLKVSQEPILNPDYEYTPDLNYNGGDAFTYRVFDGVSYSDEVSVVLDIVSVNDAPRVEDDSFVVVEDVEYEGVLLGSDVDGDPLTFSVEVQPGNGTLSLLSDGHYFYSPNTDYHGPDLFTFIAHDGELESLAGTATIVVTPVNDPPIAIPQAVSTLEDQSLSITLSATDVEAQPLGYVVTNPPAHGSLVGLAPNLVYVPNENYSESEGDFFSFLANDGELDSETVDVTIAINSVNDAPIAFDQEISLYEDVSRSGQLQASDVDKDILSFSLEDSPTGGAVSIISDGSYLYTPNANFHGVDAFHVRVADTTDSFVVFLVNVTVESINDLPTVETGSVDLFEDGIVTVTLEGEDVDGDSLTFEIITEASSGSLSPSLPNLAYMPDPDYYGTDSIEYRAFDGSEYSEPKQYYFKVAPVNDAPVANHSDFVTSEDASLAGVLSGSDVEGSALTFALETGAFNGVVSINSDGSFTYLPKANYNGPDSFTFTVFDGFTPSVASTVTLTVAPINDAPTASDQLFVLDEDTPLSEQLLASDIDGDTLKFTLEAPASNGVATVNVDGTFTYTPSADYHGPDEFEVRVKDPSASFTVFSVELTINAINDVPNANAAAFETVEDVELLSILSGSDIDGDSLSFSLARSASNGTVSINSDGSFTYVPESDYHGPDSFTFTVSDGIVNSAPAAVDLVVSPINNAPIADPLDYSVSEDGIFNGTLTGSDVDGDVLTFAIDSQASHGSVIIETDGNFAYTPSLDFEGDDSFTFTVSDGVLVSEPAQVSVIVVGENDAPLAKSLLVDLYEDIPYGGRLQGDDPDGDSLEFILVSPPVNGSVQIDNDGSFSYFPDSNFNGQDLFSFSVSDGEFSSAPAGVVLSISAVNDAPTVNPSSTSVAENGSVYILLEGVDVDGDEITFSVVSAPSQGILWVDGAEVVAFPAVGLKGELVYVATGESGTIDSFQYIANDGLLESVETTFSISIDQATNQAPFVDAGADKTFFVSSALSKTGGGWCSRYVQRRMGS